MGFRVKLLLDTCVFIWLTQEPGRISVGAAQALDDAGNELFLSHGSIWEIHLKHASGKLRLPETPRNWISQQLKMRGVSDCPIQLNSLHQTAELPPIHKDPFDRLLVAQALVESFTILTPDPFIKQYAAPILW
jgi:PIN domain nuclease of toxin-antitoxin system